MAVELANAYVTLAVETSSISKSVGRMFSGVESQAGKTGRNMGRQMASSFDKAKPNMERLEADVKLAQDRVVSHKESGSRKMEAANRRVEIAQAKVNEMTAKYGEDSSQALRAQDQLITAQQKAEAASLDYNDTLKKLEGQLNDAQKAFDDASAASGKSRGVWERVTTSLENTGTKMRHVGDRMMDVGANFKTAGGRISDVGTDLTKLTSPISVAATAAAGLVGVLGFKRLVGIDTAKAQIQGLGFDAEKVMDDVDKGLINTSMSMADGAAVARAALATGNIEVGKDLEAQVRRVANVSAAYGIESEHAGYLLNNVLTKNKVTWGDLSQMQQNQIPIVSQLADHYGVTGEEIEKMASEGKISIEDLNQVLDDSAGQSAEEYAKSWKGITENIGAYISRLGAEALGGMFETLKEEASGLVDVLSSEKAAEFARTLGEHLAVALQRVIGFVRGLVGWFAGLDPLWQKVIVGAVGFAVALGPILIVVGKLATGIGAIVTTFGALIKAFALVMNPIGLIITAVGLLVGAFTYLWKTNEGFRDFFIGLWDGISSFFVGMWENYLKPAFQAMGDFWSETLVPAFQTAWENVLRPVFEGVGAVVTWLWGNIIQPYFSFIWGLWMSLGEVFALTWENVLKPVFNWFADIAMWLWENALEPVFSWIGDKWQYVLLGMQIYWEHVLKPAFQAIATVATWLWEAVLEPVFSWIGEHWSTVMDIMVWAWENLLRPVWNVIAAVAMWLWEAVLSPVFSWIGNRWSNMIDGMVWVWTNILKPAWDFLAEIAFWLWEKVLSPVFTWIGNHWSNIIDGIVWVWQNILKPTWDFLADIAFWLWNDVLSPVFTWIGNKWSEMSDRMSNIYHEYIKPVFDKFGDVIDWLKDTFNRSVDAIKNQWDRLKDITKKPVNFVINTVYNDGIRSLFNKMVGTFGLDSWKLPELTPLATGGYTGDGHWLEPKGVVHGGEYVLNKRSTNRLRDQIGMSGLDHMNRTGRLPGYAKGGMVRPVKGGRYTSGFGAGRGSYSHAGQDIAVPINTPVFAALAGTVVKAAWNAIAGRTGKGIFLSHEGGRNTYYGHLNRILVDVGQKVKKGEMIGRSGNTGRSTGPHLHYETWTNGSPVNPMPYLSGSSILPLGEKGVEVDDPAAGIRDFLSGIVSTVTGKFDGDWAKATAEGVKGFYTKAVDKAIELGNTISGALPGGMGNATARKIRGAAQEQVKQVAAGYGWDSGAQWAAIDSIVNKESSWDMKAKNPSSSAEGLFQKMTSIHGPVESTAAGQAKWGLNYIKGRYGSPVAALDFHKKHNYYADGGLVRDSGGVVPPGSNVINNWTRDPEWMYTDKQQDTVQAALDIAKNGAGARMVFNAPVYMRDEDDFIDAYDRKARRSRAVGLVSTL